MKTNIISPRWHALLDYALTGSLLAVPTLLKFNKTARNIYATEAAVLLPYIALTDHPVAIKGIIPFKMHKKIDPLNVAHFAAQSLLPAFRKHKKELAFNIAFTVLAGITVLLTDWKAGNK